MEGGRWITINGTHVYIKEGQSPMDAFIRQKASTNNNDLNKKIENIRESKKENLIVTDENGNIIHEELGNKFHTGYENFDFKNTITYHNHPEGVLPYPSEQDFETLEKTGMKKMTVVSKNYTIEYSLDESYQGYGREGLSTLIKFNQGEINKIKNSLRQKISEDLREGKYKNSKEATIDLNKQVTEAILSKYQDLSRNSGYKLLVYKN